MFLHRAVSNIIEDNALLFSNYRRLKSFVASFYSAEYRVSRQWKKTFGARLNIEDPQTYQEKLQWLKIYHDDQLARQCADKLRVRKYVEENIGEKYLKELIAVYDNVTQIDFSKLPDQFVIKATHDSGSTLIVTDKSRIDAKKLVFIGIALKNNYGALYDEWVYDDIEPKIIIERLLVSEDGEIPADYKVFCFDGKPKIIEVCFDRLEKLKINFYDTDWNRVDLTLGLHPNIDHDMEKPELLDRMLSLSAILSKNFCHVRVDWYIHDGELIFGEMTFFPSAGLKKFSSRDWDLKMGEWIKLPVISKGLGVGKKS